ncbi:MAG: hypothetical protein HC836_31735 [Richelia sp. RM2_1_2]|nr:hypothetical protein [Richelia sp. RM2_1_2]
MAEESKKFYLLYNNKNQEKLLSTAKTLEEIQEESQYFSAGAWFECDDNNNVLSNEKYKSGIKFPKEPKIRERLVLNNTKSTSPTKSPIINWK